MFEFFFFLGWWFGDHGDKSIDAPLEDPPPDPSVYKKPIGG